MTNYEEKEAKALVKIAEVLDKLDENLAELDTLDADAKKHSMKKWIVEKKRFMKSKRSHTKPVSMKSTMKKHYKKKLMKLRSICNER